LIGGELCLDFTNTVSGTRWTESQDYLVDYGVLVEWSRQAGLITQEESERLAGEAEGQPEQAQAVHARAIELREAIFRIFSSLQEGGEANPADVEILNQELSRSLGRACLVQNAGECRWDWDHEPLTLDVMLGPIARSAADLLTSDEIPLVRECANDECSWLFLDRSRNHSRQWCDMKSCGNVVKVRRYRARKRR
jgi:predicted RNA-binding Zn ribbon-like protein